MTQVQYKKLWPRYLAVAIPMALLGLIPGVGWVFELAGLLIILVWFFQAKIPVKGGR